MADAAMEQRAMLEQLFQFHVYDVSGWISAGGPDWDVDEAGRLKVPVAAYYPQALLFWRAVLRSLGYRMSPNTRVMAGDGQALVCVLPSIPPYDG